jgi:hypothetical protein
MKYQPLIGLCGFAAVLATTLFGCDNATNAQGE